MNVAAFAERLFELLLHASPGAFRKTYAPQMRRDFREALCDERNCPCGKCHIRPRWFL